MDSNFYKYIKYKYKYNNLINKKCKYCTNANCDNCNTMTGGNGNYKISLLLFKAEWCPHCRNFDSNWKDLQKQIKNVNFVTFDSEEHKEKIKNYNIDGYPTLILEKKDKLIEYKGERTIASITNFINEYLD